MSGLDLIGAIPLILSPAFTAGFAIQQFLEVVDSGILTSNRFPNYADPGKPFIKKLILGIVGFIAALGVVGATKMLLVGNFSNVITAYMAGTTFKPYAGENGGWWNLGDGFVSALVISAGTEFFNSIIKWLAAAKDLKQAWAATQQNAATATGAQTPQQSAETFVPTAKRAQVASQAQSAK